MPFDPVLEGVEEVGVDCARDARSLPAGMGDPDLPLFRGRAVYAHEAMTREAEPLGLAAQGGVPRQQRIADEMVGEHDGHCRKAASDAGERLGKRVYCRLPRRTVLASGGERDNVLVSKP